MNDKVKTSYEGETNRKLDALREVVEMMAGKVWNHPGITLAILAKAWKEEEEITP